jgi:hypothetical protein
MIDWEPILPEVGLSIKATGQGLSRPRIRFCASEALGNTSGYALLAAGITHVSHTFPAQRTTLSVPGST